MINEAKNIIIKKLKELKIKKWDVLVSSTITYENQFRGLDVEITRNTETINYIIRIFIDKDKNMGIGVVKGSSLNETIIKDTIKNAIKIAKINSSIKYNLPSPGLKYPDLKLAEKQIVSDPFKFLEDISTELTNEIAKYPKIEPTFGKLRVYISKKRLLNHLNLDLDSKSTYIFIEYALKSVLNEKLAEYWAKGYFKNSDQLNLEDRVSKWVSITSDTLKAIRPPLIKSATVLFPPIVLKDAFRNTLGFHITGKAAVEKLSKIKLNTKIADTSFTMNDNGISKGGFGSHPWDGEGIPQRNNQVIKNGVFESRIYDIKHSKILNKESTGNGIRNALGTIDNSFTNLEILPGNSSLESIIAQISYGIIIEEFSWLNPNRITGDFGAEIRNGYLIKNGNISTPIKGGNLSGNIFDMINNIESISNERRFEENTLFPYILFKNLILSS
ncbi:MAG: metallopeptidase TldD-related protein [Candidatus Helarchaeota archaeon]